MELECYPMTPTPPDLVPGRQSRNWMDAFASRHPYRCLPLTMANTSGWEILCPVGFTAEWNGGPDQADITFKAEPAISVPDPTVPLVPVQADERADVDISGDEFDFVRSIRVYHIQFSQRRNRDGDCITSDSTRLGSYGVQGDYHWTRSSVAQVPPASDLPNTGHCNSVSYRSVFVDWRDHEGNYGFEEVRY